MITINTLYDLWKHFTVYPMCIEYLIDGENKVGYIDDMEEMKEFFDDYMDYEVIDFCIREYSSVSISLVLMLKKGETEDE